MAVLNAILRRIPARAVLLAALLLRLTIGACIFAQPAPSKEYQVKAIFLFNFAQFVDWPPDAFSDAQQPLVIGVLGDDPFGSYLDDTVRGERVNGRPLTVERYRRLEDVKTCHILFISKSEASRLKQDIDGLKAKPILTVSDINDFARKGGIIQFITVDGKIRLRINVGAAKAARLTISSKLLRPAEKIGGGGS